MFADVDAGVRASSPGPVRTASPVVGDGTITEPGRYAVICAIPVGADPAAVAEAMQTESSEPAGPR